MVVEGGGGRRARRGRAVRRVRARVEVRVRVDVGGVGCDRDVKVGKGCDWVMCDGE